MLTFDDVEETSPPPAARAVSALRAVLPPRLVAVRSMILPDVEASMLGSVGRSCTVLGAEDLYGSFRFPAW